MTTSRVIVYDDLGDIGTLAFGAELVALKTEDWLHLIQDYDPVSINIIDGASVGGTGLAVVKKPDGGFALVDLVNVRVREAA
jgi:hypothetical protein